MSMPVTQQPPSPALLVTDHPYYNSEATHASIDPLIGVLLVIIILGIIAAMIGRLCTGRKVMGFGNFDIESWIETKCSSCIDGRIYPPPQPQPPTRSNDSSAASVSTTIQHQPQQEDQSPQTPTT